MLMLFYTRFFFWRMKSFVVSIKVFKHLAVVFIAHRFRDSIHSLLISIDHVPLCVFRPEQAISQQLLLRDENVIYRNEWSGDQISMK